MKTPSEHAGDVQKLVHDEAAHLDLLTRAHFAAALWLAVSNAQEEVAKVVSRVLDAAEDASVLPREHDQMLNDITDAVARLERLVAVAANVAPPPSAILGVMEG